VILKMTKNQEKNIILIADDSEMNRLILTDMLEDAYEIVEATNGVEAVSLLHKMGTEISLVLLDIVMPEMDGFEVLTYMNKYHWIEDIPVIMISAESASSYVERSYELGVTDYINRPFDAFVVRRRVVNTIMLYAKQRKLVGLVATQIYEKQKSNSLMVNILSHIVEFRNGESGLHVLHISTLTGILLRQLAQKTEKYALSKSEISLICMASALHDIGKIAIPSEILNKPGRLTKEEFEIMKTHSEVGASMLKQLESYQDEALVKFAYEICRWHHERYDGRGYPDGLKGDEIPIAAQIVALADVYDALTSERVYKKAFSHEKALQMILNGECGSFNPLVLNCLLDVADHIQQEVEISSKSGIRQREIHEFTEEMMRYEDLPELSAPKRMLQLLEHEREKYQFFTAVSHEIQFEFASTPPMLTLSKWGTEELGLPEVVVDPVHNEQVLRLMDAEHIQEIADAARKTTPEEPMLQWDCLINICGQERWYRLICKILWSNDASAQYCGLIGKATDIHQEHVQLDLRQMASADAMTGLLTSRHAEKQIEALLQQEPVAKFALLLFDVDYLGYASQMHGAMFGDQVLKYVADLLRHSMDEHALAARVSGDEFMVFLEYQNDVTAMVEHLFRSLNGQYDEFPITVSMGVAVTESAGHAYNALFQHAKQALYVSKQQKVGQYRFYDPEMENLFMMDNRNEWAVLEEQTRSN